MSLAILSLSLGLHNGNLIHLFPKPPNIIIHNHLYRSPKLRSGLLIGSSILTLATHHLHLTLSIMSSAILSLSFGLHNGKLIHLSPNPPNIITLNHLYRSPKLRSGLLIGSSILTLPKHSLRFIPLIHNWYI